jgi:hypothetical protein
MAFSEGMLDNWANHHVPEGLRPDFKAAISGAEHRVVSGMKMYTSDSVDRALKGTRVDSERSRLRNNGLIKSLLGKKKEQG